MDAQAFSFGDEGDGWMVRRAGTGGERGAGRGGRDDDAEDADVGEEDSEVGVDRTETMMAVEADPDAFTVGVIHDADEEYDAAASQSSLSSNSPAEDLREAYGEGSTAEATAEATRRARMSNRMKTSSIDESRIGAMTMPVLTSASASASSSSSSSVAPRTPPTPITGDLSSIYEKIKSNKALANKDVEMGESEDVPRPKLEFTIYHVDSKTREVREVPQYTSPGEFFSSIEREKGASLEIVNGFRRHTRVITDESIAHGSDENISGVANGEVDSSAIDDGSDEKTYDGYQAIKSANSSSSREEELRKMKEARLKNRSKAY
jgi:hypothetical protein